MPCLVLHEHGVDKRLPRHGFNHMLSRCTHKLWLTGWPRAQGKSRAQGSMISIAAICQRLFNQPSWPPVHPEGGHEGASRRIVSERHNIIRSRLLVLAKLTVTIARCGHAQQHCRKQFADNAKGHL